jgi:hypothetical protein
MLFDRVTALMRNDSIADMTKRSLLHRSVIALVTATAKHPAFVKILMEKRPEKKRSPGLQALGGEAYRKHFICDKSNTGMAATLLTC